MRSLVCLVVLAGCSDSKPKMVDITIDPASGGSVSLSDGAAAVVIPPAALSAPTLISVSTDSTVPPAALGTPVSGTYRFGPEGTQFQKPVTVTLAADRLPSGRTLAEVFIATAAAGSTDFAPLTTSVADSSHVSAQTSHFSLFVAMVPPLQPKDASAGDAAPPDDAAMILDGAAVIDMASSPAPSCSPYPTPPPSPPCTLGPAPSPSITCGLEMICATSNKPYSVYCTLGGTCYCYNNAVVTDTFPQGSYCGLTDGGTNSGLWQRCCYPGTP